MKYWLAILLAICTVLAVQADADKRADVPFSAECAVLSQGDERMFDPLDMPLFATVVQLGASQFSGSETGSVKNRCMEPVCRLAWIRDRQHSTVDLQFTTCFFDREPLVSAYPVDYYIYALRKIII